MASQNVYGNHKVRLERIYEGFRAGGMDDASSDTKHLLLMPLKRGFFMASIEGICMIKSELVTA